MRADGAIASESSAGQKKSGTGFNGRRVVWQVENDGIKSIAELGDGFDALLDGSFNVMMRWAFSP